MKREHLRKVPLFVGKGDTIFVFEPDRGGWNISAEDGSEALVPEEDLLAFLNHCLRQMLDAAEPSL